MKVLREMCLSILIAVFLLSGVTYAQNPAEESYDKGVAYGIQGKFTKAKEEFDCFDFEIIDLFGRRLSDLEHGSPDHPFCGYQYFTVYIGGDLNVYRCCSTAYTLHGKLASLRDQRFSEAKLNYAPFDARGCQFCQFLGQNRVINGLIEKPTHVDFV